MTFQTIDLAGTEEAKPAEIGRYNLQITACELAVTGERSKNPGSPQFKATIGFVDHPETPNIRHYVGIPTGQEEDGGAFKRILLKRFLVLFNIPFEGNGFDPEQAAMAAVGQTANAEVGLGTPNENGDVYNNLIVPKLPKESSGTGRPPSKRRAA